MSFGSTPAFELFRRGLVATSVKRFRGINAFQSATTLGPDWALDALNVIVSNSGGLSKFRLPQVVSPVVGNPGGGPQSVWDFETAVALGGLRQYVIGLQNKLVYLTNDGTVLGGTIAIGPQYVGPWSAVTVNSKLFLANGQVIMKWTGAAFQNAGIAGPTIQPALGTPIAGDLSPTIGFSWGYAWKNSVGGQVSNISPISVNSGAGATLRYPLTGNMPAPPDPQVDTIMWFRTLDGGGTWYRVAEVTIATGVVTFNASTVQSVAVGANFVGIIDDTPDANLDLTTQGPLINNPLPVGKYLATGQGRTFIMNLADDPSGIAYTGYEQILTGDPEETCPPENRLRLRIGAESIAGGGVLQAGVVAFSQTGKMWMLRGAIEDITTTAPVNFTAFLEELPWTLGCMSHATIAATPYGLVWLAGDKTVQLYSGTGQPQDLSGAIYPLLQQITPGTEALAQGSYFNWLERDWYALAVATNGSQSLNTIFYFSLNVSSSEIEIFRTDLGLQADAVAVVTTSKLQRQFVIMQGGRLFNLPVESDTVGGITLDPTIIPATAGQLNAFWRSGYFGNDLPYRSKMIRWAKLVYDTPGFRMSVRLVDDEKYPINNPYFIGPIAVKGPRFGINRRAVRCSLEINFPAQDSPANVTELTLSGIPTSDR